MCFTENAKDDTPPCRPAKVSKLPASAVEGRSSVPAKVPSMGKADSFGTTWPSGRANVPIYVRSKPAPEVVTTSPYSYRYEDFPAAVAHQTSASSLSQYSQPSTLHLLTRSPSASSKEFRQNPSRSSIPPKAAPTSVPLPQPSPSLKPPSIPSKDRRRRPSLSLITSETAPAATSPPQPLPLMRAPPPSPIRAPPSSPIRAPPPSPIKAHPPSSVKAPPPSPMKAPSPPPMRSLSPVRPPLALFAPEAALESAPPLKYPSPVISPLPSRPQPSSLISKPAPASTLPAQARLPLRSSSPSSKRHSKRRSLGLFIAETAPRPYLSLFTPENPPISAAPPQLTPNKELPALPAEKHRNRRSLGLFNSETTSVSVSLPQPSLPIRSPSTSSRKYRRRPSLRLFPSEKPSTSAPPPRPPRSASADPFIVEQRAIANETSDSSLISYNSYFYSDTSNMLTEFHPAPLRTTSRTSGASSRARAPSEGSHTSYTPHADPIPSSSPTASISAPSRTVSTTASTSPRTPATTDSSPISPASYNPYVDLIAANDPTDALPRSSRNVSINPGSSVPAINSSGSHRRQASTATSSNRSIQGRDSTSFHHRNVSTATSDDSIQSGPQTNSHNRQISTSTTTSYDTTFSSPISVSRFSFSSAGTDRPDLASGSIMSAHEAIAYSHIPFFPSQLELDKLRLKMLKKSKEARVQTKH